MYWDKPYNDFEPKTTEIDLFATFTIDIHNNKLHIYLVPEIMM